VMKAQKNINTKSATNWHAQVIILLLVFFSACHKGPAETIILGDFEDAPVASPVIAGFADEASGIADSHTMAGSLWVEQDGGNQSELILISQTGSFIKRIPVNNATNRDWEDMVISKDVANKTWVYIADIGDNNEQETEYFIYRFEEPAENSIAVDAPEKISFKYPDGSHDAEAILVDAATRDIYIITKRDAVSKIYRLPFPQSTSSVISAEPAGSLAYNGVVSAAMSPDAKDIIIKTYTDIYYYKRQTGETIAATLQSAAVRLKYIMEPQGEAVCFKNDNSGFFTLSEKGLAPSVDLRFYKRK
jgi:hypothetical protein